MLFSSADATGPQRRGLTVSDKAALACWFFTSPVCFLLIFWIRTQAKSLLDVVSFYTCLTCWRTWVRSRRKTEILSLEIQQTATPLFFNVNSTLLVWSFFLVRYNSGGKEWSSICSLDLQKLEMDKAVFVKWPCKHCMDCVLCVHECVKVLYLRVEITLEVSTFMNTARHLATKSDIFF